MKSSLERKIERLALAVALSAGMTFAAAPAMAADDCPTGDQMTKSGTLSGWGKSAGWIVGARWGQGTLVLNDGSEHEFTFNGAKLLETGIAEADFVGNVYNLSNIEDFAGDFATVSQGFTLVEGITGAAVLKNDNCVFIEVDVKSKGVRVSAPAPGSVVVKLENH